MAVELIYALNQLVTVPGSLGIGNIKDEGKIRFVITGAGPANVVRVRARLTNQLTWVNLIDITANDNQLIDVIGYDQLEVICLVFNSLNGIGFNIVASSFDGTSLYITTPDGTIDGAVTLNFVSSNGTVDISGNPVTGEVDFRVTAASGARIPYPVTFIIADWVLDGSLYKITVLESNHILGVNPTINVFENATTNFEEVEIGYELNPVGDVTITVPQTPDLRFDGKIIIS